VAQDVTLLIKLQDQASGKLGKITNSTKRLEQAVSKAQNSIQRTNKGITATGRAAETASRGVNKLGKAIRSLALGFGAFQAGKFVIFKTAELERQTKSLEVLTGSLGNARNIISELQQFGAVTPFTSSELIETAKRMKAFGFETEQVVDVTKRLADVAGATGADLGGIATAFGQIQAKGRLQGEELLQLQERGVSLQDELQKMYGLTADEFRKALEGGRISADAVNLALQNITDTGGKYANGAIAQSDTLAGKFSTLVDQIERVAQKIGDTLSPALKGALTLAINVVDNINRAFAASSITDEQKQQFKQQAEQEVMRFAGPMPGGPFGAGEVVVRHLGKTYRGSASSVVSQITNDLINKEIQNRVEGSRGPAATAPTVQTPPALLPGRGGDKESAEARKTRGELEKQAEAAKRIAQQSKARVRTLEEQTRLAAALTEEERIQIERNIEIENIKAQIGVKTQEQVDAELAATKALYEQQDVTKARLKQEEEMAELKKKAQEEEKKRAEELNSVYQGIGNTIADGVVTALQGAVNGTVSLAEAATSLLNNLINQMLQLAANMILFGNIMGTMGGMGGGGGGGLFGFISTGIQAIVGGLGGGIMGGPGYFDPATGLGTAGPNFGLALGGIVGRNGIVPFAKGGVVNRPTLFPMANGMGLMGEAGPEAVMPLRRGPGGRLGVEAHGGGGPTNIVVNVDASGSSVEADGQQQKALGKAIAAAIQSEIAKQKRPGGLLS